MLIVMLDQGFEWSGIGLIDNLEDNFPARFDHPNEFFSCREVYVKTCFQPVKTFLLKTLMKTMLVPQWCCE